MLKVASWSWKKTVEWSDRVIERSRDTMVVTGMGAPGRFRSPSTGNALHGAITDACPPGGRRTWGYGRSCPLPKHRITLTLTNKRSKMKNGLFSEFSLLERLLWSLRQLEAMVMSTIHASVRNHAEVHDPCHHQLLRAMKLPGQWYRWLHTGNWEWETLKASVATPT